MKNICVVTGSRADYGLLRPLLTRVQKDNELTLSLMVTGSHLSYLAGQTYLEIEQDGFYINNKIEMNLASDTAVGICKSMGLALISFAEAYDQNKPDMIVLLGDRYEIFAAATAAMISKIPIAHIHGGELTFGAYDDSIRHAITKMSTLHFTSTNEYRQRVIQMGEPPDLVHYVGALGIEAMNDRTLLTKKELEEIFQLSFDQPLALVTFHPITLDNTPPAQQLHPLLKALDSFDQIMLIFTKANADEGGLTINQMIDSYVEKNQNRARVYPSLGSLVYLSILRYCFVVIGNSSSGIIEAPTFGVPTVDIGDRQKGRIKPSSVISCSDSELEIMEAIHIALRMKREGVKVINPYEKVNTSQTIMNIIKQALDDGITCKKEFFSGGLLCF
jgi:UDP-N-acetylglucosamine 2-epimerase (non-hydrolysing)/GDP/UDP-N,N'-diacetylbacillosamine 2-epimerase (hydrolysing)